ALVRQMPFKAAAAMFANCDNRLWRQVDHDAVCLELLRYSEASSPSSDERSAGKGPDYLNLFYDLDTTFEVPGEDASAAKTFGEELKAKSGNSGNSGGDWSELSKAFF